MVLLIFREEMINFLCWALRINNTNNINDFSSGRVSLMIDGTRSL